MSLDADPVSGVMEKGDRYCHIADFGFRKVRPQTRRAKMERGIADCGIVKREEEYRIADCGLQI